MDMKKEWMWGWVTFELAVDECQFGGNFQMIESGRGFGGSFLFFQIGSLALLLPDDLFRFRSSLQLHLTELQQPIQQPIQVIQETINQRFIEYSRVSQSITIFSTNTTTNATNEYYQYSNSTFNANIKTKYNY